MYEYEMHQIDTAEVCMCGIAFYKLLMFFVSIPFIIFSLLFSLPPTVLWL